MTNYEDDLEIEFKFVPREPESSVMARMTQLFAPEYGFAKWPPCANLDIYLDTPDLLLYRANTPLRLRRWATPYKLKEGISANFKCTPGPGSRLPVTGAGLRRREIKTVLSPSEAQQVCTGAIVGETLHYAAEISGLDKNGRSGLRPWVTIATQQSLYTLRPHAEPGRASLRRGNEFDLLYLTFERCTIQAISMNDELRLLKNGMSDVDTTNKVVELYEAELEIVADDENLDLAHSLYLRAHDFISTIGVEMPTRSKYSAAVEALKAG